jgi:hypothetical protein
MREVKVCVLSGRYGIGIMYTFDDGSKEYYIITNLLDFVKHVIAMIYPGAKRNWRTNFKYEIRKRSADEEEIL